MNIEQLAYEQKTKILDDFLLNSAQLLELSPYFSSINIFDVLNIKNYEIRHSNILAWLLDPYGSHGCGSRFTKLFVERVIRVNPSHRYDPMEWVFLDYGACEVYREKHWPDIQKRNSLDILLVMESDSHHHLIAIENKVNAKESVGQTEKYRHHLESEYPSFRKMYVYLTVDNDAPQDSEWATVSYLDVYELLKVILDYSNLNPESKIIIANYRKVVGEMLDIKDELIREKVKKIYKENRAAIDLINMYKPDIQSDIADYIADKIHTAGEEEYKNAIAAGQEYGNIMYEVSPVQSGIIKAKSYVRFNTRKMNDFIEPLPNKTSNWNTKDNYYYETSFWVKDDKLTCSFTIVLNGKNIGQDSKAYKNGEMIRTLTGYKGKSGTKKNTRNGFEPVKSKPIEMDAEEYEWMPVIDEFVDTMLRKVNDVESKLSQNN